MASILPYESRRLYSWWWDSHISPKNSKWLQENLTDMDMNLKAMIKLIEEDADSFAKRAEMYYKKRPELMKLVEEFYRAYRALAEKYDHATGALRQAHRTMAEAFPNQIPSTLSDESPTTPGSDIGPHTPEMPSPMRAMFDPDELYKDALGLSSNFHAISRIGAYSEENDALSGKKGLKQLNELFPTGEVAARVKFSEGKVRKGLSFLEREGNGREKEDLRNEMKHLQEEMSKLSTEHENLKSQMVSESEHARNLKDTLAKLELEKEAALLEYNLSLERISDLNSELTNTREELVMLDDEMVAKLNSAEERCLAMEQENQSLRLEWETRQKELEQKERDLEELNSSIQNENQKRVQAEVALMSMEKMHFQSHEKVKVLELEIQSGVGKLKDMEVSKVRLEEEVHKLKEINGSLNEKNHSFALKIKDLQDEMVSLKDTKGRLEEELGIHVEEKKALQQDLDYIKEDRNGVMQMHHGLNKQMEILCLKMEVVSAKNEVLENSLSDANVEIIGLRKNVKALEASCETLTGEISHHVAEKSVMVSQIEMISQDMEKLSEKCALLENSLSDSDTELQGLRAKIKDLEESRRFLCDQNSSLLAEKNTFFSQVESLESRYSELQDKHSNVEKKKDLTVHQVKVLESSLRLEKQEHEALILSSNSQLALLQEEIKVKQEEFEAEEQRGMSSQFEVFILQSCLCDMKNKNSVLSIEYHNLLEAFRCAEKLISQLEYNDCNQKKEITLLSDHNKNVSGGILQLLKALNVSNECGASIGSKDEVRLQIILDELRNLLSCISDAQDENQRHYLETLVLFSHLKQIGLDKIHLCCELERRTKESVALVSEKQELMEMIGQLKADKDTLVCQVETISQSLKNVGTKYSKLEDRHFNLEREKDSTVHQIMELENSLRLEKQEHEALIRSTDNQNLLLQEENQVKETELEVGHQRIMNSLLQTFILQRCLCDIRDKYLILSEECQKHQEASRCLDEVILQLKANDVVQKNKITSLSEDNYKLRKGILLLIESLNKEGRTIDGNDEVLLQAILDEVKSLLSSFSDAQDEIQHLRLEISVLVTLLKHAGLEKDHLYHEHERQAEESAVLRIKNHELTEANGELESEKRTLLAQVELFRQSLESQEIKYSELEGKHSNLEKQKDSVVLQVKELGSSLVLEKQKLEDLIFSNRSQIAALQNQIHILQEECQIKGEEIEEEQQKSMSSLLEIFILQRILCDVKENNLVLSKECQKHLEAARCLERLISQLEHEGLIQKENMALLSEDNQKLREGILLIVDAVNIDKERGTMERTKDEALLKAVFHEIKSLQCSTLDAQNENQCLQFQVSVLVTLLKQIGLEKYHLHQELESQTERSEQLKTEMLLLQGRFIGLQESYQRSQNDIRILHDENWSLSKILYELREEVKALEEENGKVLAEVMTLNHLYLFFRSLSAERALELKLFSDDIGCLLALRNDLEEENRVANERESELEAETTHLKHSVVVLEVDLSIARTLCEELKLQIVTGEDLLAKKNMELFEVEEKNAELHRKLEGVYKDIEGFMVVREELEKRVITLLEGNASKDEEINSVHKANRVLNEEVDRFNNEVGSLRRRQEYLTSELKRGSNEINQCGAEIATLLNDLQFSTINSAIFEEKVFELAAACESLEICAMVEKDILNKEIAMKNAGAVELMSKVEDFEEENTALKAELNAYSLLVVSLWDGITSLEERTLSLARIQDRQDDYRLASNQNDKNSAEFVEEISASAKIGALGLKKLNAKVEALRKVIMDFESLLRQERLYASANIEAARKEIEELKLKERSGREISKEKYGQTMKDIQLDQVSSSCIASTDDQMLELWETAEIDDIQAVVEEEKSEYPSSELAAEKELTVDKIEVSAELIQSPQEWKKRISERLSSDAQKLSILRKGIHGLENKLGNFEKKKYPKELECGTFKAQLREAEEAVLAQVDVNDKLKKRVEDPFESSDNVIWEKERRLISERARRGSEKIAKLELELQKIEYVFLKFGEEEKKSGGSVDRKPSVLLREYLHSRRDGKRKVSFCGCMRPKTKS